MTFKQFKGKIFGFIAATLGKAFMNCLLRTCRWKVEGNKAFDALISKEKCLLTLWHNRLAIAPYILHRFVPGRTFAALVSNSRDGELISKLVTSYKNGRVVKVAHNSRHYALKEVIQHVDQRDHTVAITPDGPRGPRYKLKPGLAMAALETEAHLVILDWSASHYWEIPTWDRLRIPKPFSQISATFTILPPFNKESTQLNDVVGCISQAMNPHAA